jgi:putative ABC transport system permease protein
MMRSKFMPSLEKAWVLRSYLKVAFRHLSRHKTFSIINIAGLSIGVSAFLLIVQYVSFETSFDNFHENGRTLYRVGLERHIDGSIQSTAQNFAGLRKLLRSDFPEVFAATGFYKTPANTGVLFSYKGKIFNELGGELNADSSFFLVFPSLLLRGDPETALHDPHSIVLTETMARKVFGDVDPMGLQIQFPNDGGRPSEYTVTGILKEIPENSHFHAKFVVPLQYFWGEHNEWKQDFLMTYVSLADPDVDPKALTERLSSVYKSLSDQYPAVKDTKPFLQPITSIHLDSNFQDELEANGSRQLVYLACIIGLVILALAWINYVNLETSRFVTMAREVGVRRIIGSAKSDLALQFVVEYMCLVLVAVVLALAIVNLVVPKFSFVTGIPIATVEWSAPEVWIVAITVLISGSVLAGSYPALFLYRLNPVAAIKGKLGEANRGRSMRRALLVIQFCSSLILIACVLVINQQLDFMRIANIKFDVDQVITLRNPTAYSGDGVQTKHQAYRTLENELLQNSSVKSITSSSAIPGTEIGFTYVNLLKRDKNAPYDPTRFKTLFIDYNYIPFFGLRLIAGRNFSAPADQWVDPLDDEQWLTIILNESAIHALGFRSPEEAVDQVVEFHNFGDDFQKHRIIGVIEDYHHEAIKRPIMPMILSPNYGSFQQVYYSIRLNPGADPQGGLADIEASWKRAFPEKPFDYAFLNDYYDAQFKSELHTRRTFSLFAGIAILLGCLGILGMTLFEASARLKEISIRKVLGASAASLVALLSRENIRLVFISSVISIPVIYLLSKEWLATYPASVGVSLSLFLIPMLALLMMVLGTSALETIKASRANPVDHLKNEG